MASDRNRSPGVLRVDRPSFLNDAPTSQLADVRSQRPGSHLARRCAEAAKRAVPAIVVCAIFFLLLVAMFAIRFAVWASYFRH